MEGGSTTGMNKGGRREVKKSTGLLRFDNSLLPPALPSNSDLLHQENTVFKYLVDDPIKFSLRAKNCVVQQIVFF